MREFADDVAEVAEHEQGGESRAHNALSVTSCRTSHEQKFFDFDFVPWGTFASHLQSVAIAAKRVLIQIGNRHVFDKLVVAACMAAVAQHGIHHLFIATIIAFAVTAIGTRIRIGSNKDWAVMAGWAWYIYDDYCLAVAIDRIDASVEKDVRADFLAVVDAVPDFLHQLFGVFHALYMIFAVDLLHAQQDNAAICVGEGGITVPKGLRQIVLRLLELHAVCFWCRQQFYDVIGRQFFHLVSSDYTAFKNRFATSLPSTSDRFSLGGISSLLT